MNKEKDKIARYFMAGRIKLELKSKIKCNLSRGSFPDLKLIFSSNLGNVAYSKREKIREYKNELYRTRAEYINIYVQ